MVIDRVGNVGAAVTDAGAAPEPFKATLNAPLALNVPVTALVEAASNLIVAAAGSAVIVCAPVPVWPKVVVPGMLAAAEKLPPPINKFMLTVSMLLVNVPMDAVVKAAAVKAVTFKTSPSPAVLSSSVKPAVLEANAFGNMPTSTFTVSVAAVKYWPAAFAMDVTCDRGVLMLMV